MVAVGILSFPALTTPLRGQEKVVLEEPKQPDLAAELAKQPDGVLNVKTNEDGGFKSLVVKATVEIEDVLGAAKGKQLARKEAEVKCKQALAKFLQEDFVMAEGANNSTVIETRGDSSKDAAGNTVKVRTQKGTEIKARTEISASKAQAIIKGMIVLHSAVTDTKEPEYVLIMGINQTTMSQAVAVAAALSGNGSSARNGTKQNESGKPDAESKTNPAIKGF